MSVSTPGVLSHVLDKAYQHVRVNANAAAFTVYLPPAADFVGQELCILKTDASTNALTVAVHAGTSDTLNLPSGRNPLTAQWAALRLRSTGTAWEIAV